MCSIRSVRVLDLSRIGPVLTGDRRDLGNGPPVAAMLIQNTNPMVVAPEHPTGSERALLATICSSRCTSNS